MTEQQQHSLMTAREVAAAFRVDVKTVYSWVKKGKLSNVGTPTGGVRILASQVQNWLDAGLDAGIKQDEYVLVDDDL